MEGFVELWRPVVALGLCGVLALLVIQVGANQVDLNERPEHAGCLPLEVVGCYHCQRNTHNVKASLYT